MVRKLGVLGGGQLGRMLVQAGLDWNIPFSILDPDSNAPCHELAAFQQGNLTDYETVFSFGRACDLVTIEIENVNTTALRDLEAAGVAVYPQPHVIALIQDKRAQKKFYQERGIPTAEFYLTENRNDVTARASFLPAVNKLGREGYDGRGVQILRTAADLPNAFDAPGLLEKLVDFKKEVAVIVARNAKGDIVSYPAVEMVFHPTANLVEYLFSPAQIPAPVASQADAIARQVIEQLGMVGLLAVEMFVTQDDQILVNEIAPRPHNSGHQTIEGNRTSQYHQHLRAILNLPLGSTETLVPTAMVNLLGEAGHEGLARYEGLDLVLATPGIFVHLYGKKYTKPFRKMGHVTITDSNMESLKKKATFVKQTLRVVA
jgi:5-(carboxyamino)imidazole ribonucleotide synthase